MKSKRVGRPHTNVTSAFRGLQFSADRSTIQINLDEVDASPYQFHASDFRIGRDGSEIALLFGNNSRWAVASAEFDFAVEIYVPLDRAYECFVDGVFNQNSLLRQEPFIRSLENLFSLEVGARLRTHECTKSPPMQVDHRMRVLHANFASAVLTGEHESAVEFYFIPPTWVAYTHTGRARLGDGVRSVITVLMDPRLLFALCHSMNRVLPEKPQILRKGG